MTEETQVKEPFDRYLLIGFIAIFILVVGMFGWSLLAQIKGAVIAPGTLVVEGRAKTIQHLDGGIVGEILVREGDYVEKDAVLMRLDPTILEANREIVQSRLYEGLARLARLEAERDELDSIVWPGGLEGAQDDINVRNAMDGQVKLFETRKKAREGIENQLRQRIAQQSNQIDGLNSLIASQNRQLELLTNELADLARGLEKGVVSRTRYNSVARQQSSIEGEMSRNEAEIARLRNAISETRVEILQQDRDHQEQVLQTLREAQSEVNDLQEQLTSATDQRRRIDILAPESGVVHNLSVTTIGGVVRPGEDLLQIIPQDNDLIIEAQVQTQDIDQVYDGQPATIRFSAFNQRRTPELNGTVLNRAPDRLIDEVTGVPYYAVKLTVPPEELERLGNLNLIPGMPVEAFMQTQSRSVWSYLVKPATDAMRRAGREE